MDASNLRNIKLYVDPGLLNDGRDPRIAAEPTALWAVEGSSPSFKDVKGLVLRATEMEAVPQLVAYNIPRRDSGGFSAGGAKSSRDYRAWIDSLADAIGHHQAIIILEPDALAQLQDLSTGDQIARLQDLSYAVDVLASKTDAYVYIDAGNSAWHGVSVMATRLKRAGIDKARGFSLNVSNFRLTNESAIYGDALAKDIGSKHYVIDTSRNGQGPPLLGSDWCNPPGRGLGTRPTTQPKFGKYADAYLWIKIPGESDGTRHNGPPAGEWYESYAEMLTANANY